MSWREQPRFGQGAWECGPEEAQEYLNVPLLWPEEHALPEGMKIGTLTIRPEGEDAWSSARLVLAGGGRQLRLKQYHFDWWRPTDLAACLRRTLGFYRTGDTVAAWGRDYGGRAAACMAWGRTTVELHVDRGTFVELELRHLLAHLGPAVPDALPALAAPAFHEISYHARRGRGPRQLDELAAADWSDRLALVAGAAPSPILLPDPLPRGWRFDAASLWPTPPPEEAQWLLRDAQGMTLLYGRVRPTHDAQPLKLPAVYRPQEGWRVRQTMIRQRRTTLAYQHPDLGGWSAAWAEGGHRYQSFVRAGALPGMNAFRELIERLKRVS
ncbi:MAG: hypothetical protein ACRDIB_07945 [Ardenticatenaceae bacterium]